MMMIGKALLVLLSIGAAAQAQQFDNTTCSATQFQSAQDACAADPTCLALPWKNWNTDPGKPKVFFQEYTDGQPNHWGGDEKVICDHSLGKPAMDCYIDTKGVRPKCFCAQKKVECNLDKTCSSSLTRAINCCANEMCRSSSQMCPHDFVGGGDCPPPPPPPDSSCSSTCEFQGSTKEKMLAMVYLSQFTTELDKCKEKYPDKRRFLLAPPTGVEHTATAMSHRRLVSRHTCPDNVQTYLQCTWDHCKDEKDASGKMSCMAEATGCDDPSSHAALVVLLILLATVVLCCGGCCVLYVKKKGPFAAKELTEPMYMQASE